MGANLMFRSRPGTNFYWTLGNIIIARIFNGQPRKHEDILIEGRRISYIFLKNLKLLQKLTFWFYSKTYILFFSIINDSKEFQNMKVYDSYELYPDV